jgi:hypothetical protein
MTGAIFRLASLPLITQMGGNIWKVALLDARHTRDGFFLQKFKDLQCRLLKVFFLSKATEISPIIFPQSVSS